MNLSLFHRAQVSLDIDLLTPGYDQVYEIHFRLIFSPKSSYCHHLLYNSPGNYVAHTQKAQPSSANDLHQESELNP